SQIGDQSSNIARFAVLAAGWPVTIPGTTVNRACGSSQQAVDFAAQAVAAGACDVIVAGGVESMSRLPLGVTRQSGFPYGPRVMQRFDDFSFNQGLCAEAVARKWGLTRVDLDAYAAASHQRTAAAIDSGAFDAQIIVLSTETGEFDTDEGLRRGTSIETLGQLKPLFIEDGLIHAGNSSQISDGAAALLITTADRAADLGLRPWARIHTAVLAGSDPVTMLTAPIPATAKALARAGLSMSDIGTFEVNEAFASVVLAWLKDTGASELVTNPSGGAIALGHPLGASGARLMTTMVHRMRRDGIRFGLQT
ncbi:thiolase family protein, partial [Mycobacterium mantenii]